MIPDPLAWPRRPGWPVKVEREYEPTNLFGVSRRVREERRSACSGMQRERTQTFSA